jgi:hypothetical protein
MNLHDRLEQARNHAYNGGLPVRRKDGKLYAILAECLSICEEVIRDQKEDELRAAVKVSVDCRNPEVWGKGRAAGNAGKGKRYAESTSDAYILVARYVLEGVDNRNSVYRYASTLRAAGERQIASSDLVEWLENNGGVVALYRERLDRAPLRSTKTLYLDRPVSFQIGVEFSVKVVALGGGKFAVLD